MTIALILLLSTYSGKTLLQFVPLRWLDEPVKEKKGKSEKKEKTERQQDDTSNVS